MWTWTNRMIVAAFAAAISTSAMAFEVKSPEFREGKTLSNEQVFKGFGCSGDNVSPQVSWKNAPEGTRSFAVTVYDPDAPTGSGWWHWTVFNIPAHVTQLAKGAGVIDSTQLPSGAQQGRTDFGSAAFGGACPPVGNKPHRYQLTVWALNTDKIDLNDQASGALVGYMLHAHALGQARVTALYGR